MAKLNIPKEATFKGPAMLWKRLLAFILDLLILDFVIGGFYRLALGKILPKDFSAGYAYFASHPKMTSLITLISLLFGILALFYFALLEYFTGQTVGKMFANIKVESDIGQMSFFQAVMRSMYFIVFFPFFLLWLLDPIFVFFTKDRRRLSEILSKTRTVEIYPLNPQNSEV